MLGHPVYVFGGGFEVGEEVGQVAEDAVGGGPVVWDVGYHTGEGEVVCQGYEREKDEEYEVEGCHFARVGFVDEYIFFSLFLIDLLKKFLKRKLNLPTKLQAKN